MPDAASLLDTAQSLIADPAARQEFALDPEGFLAVRGLDGLTADDVAVAFEHLGDALPAAEAVQLPRPDPTDPDGFDPGGADDPVVWFGGLTRVEPAETDPGGDLLDADADADADADPDADALAFGRGAGDEIGATDDSADGLGPRLDADLDPGEPDPGVLRHGGIEDEPLGPGGFDADPPGDQPVVEGHHEVGDGPDLDPGAF